MKYERRDNSGVLFKSDKTHENQPSMTGKIMVAGTEYRLAAWTKKRSNGDKWLSLAVSDINLYSAESFK